MAPILVAGLQRLFDEEAAEARAVDEEIGLENPAILQRHGRNVAAVVDADVDDLAFGAHHSMLLGEAAEILRIKRGIEVEGVGDMADGRIRHVLPARA